MKNAITLVISGLILLLSGSIAGAQRDHEMAAGEFVRSDGVRFNIVRHWTDGLTGSDVEVEFRDGSGAIVTNTEFVGSEIVVRPANGIVRLYEFEDLWIPRIRYVEDFDGFHLTRRLVPTASESVYIHLTEHWINYGTLPVLGVLWWLARRWLSLRPTPTAASALFKAFGLIFCYAGALIYIGLIIAEPISPLIFLFTWALIIITWIMVRRFRAA